MRSIYVFGFFQTSPGKTVVSTALCRGLLNRGFNVAPFKPRSGHNLWFQHDAFDKCKKEARLFCEDVIKLKEAARCRLPYEILNPVDALMAPLDTKAFLKKNCIRRIYLKQPNTFDHFLVERYTSWEDGKAKSTLCVSEKNLSGEVLFDSEYIRDLMEKAENVLKVKDVVEWTSVFRNWGPVSISTCSRRIADEHELMVVEGFNDAVCPAPKLRYEAVLGVGPGTAAFYDPGDFERVIRVKSMIGGDTMGLRSKDVIQYIKPDGIWPIPALSSNNLISFDVLSEELGNIIDAVLKRLKIHRS